MIHRKPLQYRPFGVFANMANAAQDWKRQTWRSIHLSLVFMPAPLPPAYTFGLRLREARLARGMNQAALGAVLGLEEQNSAAPRISRYERGDRMPDNESMAKLAEALELPVAYFHAASDIMAEAILVLSQLPPAKQEELLRHMREFAGVSEKESFAVNKAKK
ncbi:helix-turn-helix transcriptional regulator [Xanthomonas citri pv. anacardii]|uniref:helix-turn-helix domain-containing protein n=3 Tax=Xanthomonas citri TaxID=346 RepID=UPI0027D1F39E|nr:helix-turn-helix transcriptional regulator [Xanthomonas citri]